MSIRWLYLLTGNPTFPDPRAEVGALYQLLEDGAPQVHIILADRPSPPMCTAGPRDRVLLCTRPVGHRLVAHGIAHVGGAAAVHSRTPAVVAPLYGARPDRSYVPISRIDLIAERPVHELSDAEQATFARGQAFVRRLGPAPRRRAASSARPNPAAPLLPTPDFEPRALRLAHPLDGPIDVVGLDPTAGTWDTRMRAGPKEMPAVALRLYPDGRVRAAPAPLTWHKTNASYWQEVVRRHDAGNCIDGPCATNGLPVRRDWAAWGDLSHGAQRAAELALARMGIGLFWTTRATLERFDGASRWIARSLRLFHEAPSAAPGTWTIETHPHGVFTVLWRALGSPDPLLPKQGAAGRAQRLAVLRAFVPDLDEGHVPDHDAVDAAAAALVACFHAAGSTTAYGAVDAGGLIWLPSA